MQIIDFERKGQQVKFYLGDHKLLNYYGDDWDDKPYEHNAGKVYDEYISGERTLTFNWNDIVLEPSDGCDNSPYCKDDMRTRKVPCICVLTEEHQDDWTSYWSFTDIVGNDNAEKFYFGDFLLPDSEVTEFARINVRNLPRGQGSAFLFRYSFHYLPISDENTPVNAEFIY